MFCSRLTKELVSRFCLSRASYSYAHKMQELTVGQLCYTVRDPVSICSDQDASCPWSNVVQRIKIRRRLAAKGNTDKPVQPHSLQSLPSVYANDLTSTISFHEVTCRAAWHSDIIGFSIQHLVTAQAGNDAYVNLAGQHKHRRYRNKETKNSLSKFRHWSLSIPVRIWKSRSVKICCPTVAPSIGFLTPTE